MSDGALRLTAVPILEEVAERAGVSRSTASRAINGGLRVSPEALAAVDGPSPSSGTRRTAPRAPS